MNDGQTVPLQAVLLLSPALLLLGLALHLWAWRHLQDETAKRRVWSSIVLLGAMLILLFLQVVYIGGSLRVAMTALAGGPVVAGVLLGASRVNLSNNPLRNAWWSGFLQGLTITLTVVALVLLTLASMRV